MECLVSYCVEDIILSVMNAYFFRHTPHDQPGDFLKPAFQVSLRIYNNVLSLGGYYLKINVTALHRIYSQQTIKYMQLSI